MSFEIEGLDGRPVSLSMSHVQRLNSQIQGGVLRPGDARWNESISIWNGMLDKRPALAIQPGSTADVVAAVRFAREHGVLLGVKGGGHNIAGTAIAERGLLLDMSRMRGIHVDPRAKLATVGPGCQLRDVDGATQAHGLATVLGFVSEVGVAGLTLGGGLGYLTRRFGWTVDNLESVQIVTADGEIRSADRNRNADLFWAVRGGGGNFGIVTEFRFHLHEVGPQVYGGLIAWPLARAEAILEMYRDLSRQSGPELAAWLVLLHAPPAPFVPEHWHHQPICAMSVCYSGDLARTNEALRPLRAIGEPAFDLLHVHAYTEQQSYLDATEPKGLHHHWKTEYLSELSDDLLATLRELYTTCPGPEVEIGILHLAGALNSKAPDDGAVGNRDARYVVGVKGMWEAGHPKAAVLQKWIRDAWQRVRPFSTGATYINFLSADEDPSRVEASYGRNYAKLLEIKRRYDPSNFFRVNKNIWRPVSAAAST